MRALRPIAIHIALAVLAGCAANPLDEGQALIDQGQYRAGLAKLEQALRERPNDPDARLRYTQSREQVVNRILNLAAAELQAGQFDDASHFYREVLYLDAGNARAQAGLAAIDLARRHQMLLADAKARFARGDVTSAEPIVKTILAENPNHVQARELERELRERERKQAIATPALKSRLSAPVTLTFRDAPLRSVIEALSRSTDLNFILDREIRPDLRVTIFVKQVRVEDAIELILRNNQLEQKVLTENTILIYPNTPQKRAEHQELVMRTFHVGNADPKQILNLLRTILKTKDVHVDERANLIVMRDTPDVIRTAERLIASQDVAEPEVMLELEILEVARAKVRDLGITYPTVFTGPGGTLRDVGELNSRNITVDTGFALRLLRTDGETKTLANPRVRVRNKERARIHIGDRVPVISSTIVGTSVGGAQPVTTEQIQYLDVGIKIEAEPTIYADGTVAVRINLDVSSLGAQTKTNAGTTAYEVGTRNAATVLRLRDGETQALMGLIRDDDVQTGSGLPFIGELPILNRIFGTRRTDQRSRELVLLITPRLVRAVQPTDASLAEFWTGTESALRLRPPVIQSIPAGDTLAAKGAAVQLANAPPSTLPPPAPLALAWRVPESVKTGNEFSVELRGRSDAALKGASVQLRYDPAQVEIIAVENGELFRQAGDNAVFTQRVDSSIGVVFATAGAAGGVSVKGEGSLISIRAKARGKAAGARLQLSSIVGIDMAGRQVPVEGTKQVEIRLEP
jgi:general secretion pathway protein D